MVKSFFFVFLLRYRAEDRSSEFFFPRYISKGFFEFFLLNAVFVSRKQEVSIVIAVFFGLFARGA